jgi:hypothetical protein
MFALSDLLERSSCRLESALGFRDQHRVPAIASFVIGPLGFDERAAGLFLVVHLSGRKKPKEMDEPSRQEEKGRY